MSTPPQAQGQQQQPRKRSHLGCWTCKQKRRRCDNTRPICQNCQRLGIHCEGYELRLRWGTGIASRGRFTGADKPLEESIPPRPKGRRRDLVRRRVWEEQQVQQGQQEVQPKVQQEEAQGQVVDTTPSPSQSSPRSQDEILFQEFLTSGVNVLHSTTVNNSLLVHGLPQLCQQSRALYAICLAFQVTLTPDLRPRFFEYFDAALSTFRSELAMSVTGLDDGTLTAGLLLCSIGIIHGLPWTMHLEGMHSILQSHGLDNYRSPFRTHLIEVMGVMDMPTFAVGRQNPNIGIWRRYCRKNGRPDEDVEPVSGLPRSLLDIFACIGEGATEETFWDWPGERGSFLQCHLWEAFRLAGILACRQLQQRQTRLRQRQQRQLLNGQLVGGPKLKDYPPSSSSPSSASSPTTPSSSWSSRQPRLPRTEILVARILASLDALRRACTEPTEPTEKDSLIINAIEYPIFVAGLEVDLMNANPEWKRAIMECFADRYRQETGEENRLATQLLEELWTRGEGDVNELARERGLELGLF